MVLKFNVVSVLGFRVLLSLLLSRPQWPGSGSCGVPPGGFRGKALGRGKDSGKISWWSDFRQGLDFLPITGVILSYT